MNNTTWDQLLFSFIRGMPENFVNGSITLAEINKYIGEFIRDHKLESEEDELSDPTKINLSFLPERVEIGHSKWVEEFLKEND